MSARPKHPARSARPAVPSERARARAVAHSARQAEAAASHADPNDRSSGTAESAAAGDGPDASELITRVGPERTCVGCGEKGPPSEMVRIVLGPPPAEKGGAREVAVDAGGGSFGRGAHLHPRPSCVAQAAQRGLPRSFKASLTIDGARLEAEPLARAIAALANRRIEGLLGAARRAHRMALGADAVVAASRAGDAHLIVVATDAASAADLSEVRRAVAEGRAVAWATKDQLAAAAGGSERAMGLGVVAITDTRIARAVRDAARLLDAMLQTASSTASSKTASSKTASSKTASSKTASSKTASPARPASGKPSRETRGHASDSRSNDSRAAQVSERRGGATDVNGGTPRPEKASEPSDDGSQAVE